MAFDYTNLYPDTSSNGAFTKSWNYTTLDTVATVLASGYFNKVATRVGIGDNIFVSVVDALGKTRTTLVDFANLYVESIIAGVVVTFEDGVQLDATPGLVVQIDDVTFTKRIITGTANQITVVNGDGVSGNPVLSLPASINLSGGLTLLGSTSGTTQVNSAAVAGTSVLTLPAGTDTLVGKATTDVLSNKTLTGTTTNNDAAAGIVGEYIDTSTDGDNASATVTMTIAAPCVVTWAAHGFRVGAVTTAVKFTTTGALPTGVVSGTTYYATAINSTTFNISTTADNALAGTFITTTGAQSGVQTGDIRIVMASVTPQNVAAISLTAGDWDVGGQLLKGAGATTTVTYLGGNLTTTSAAQDRTWGRRLTFQYSLNTFVPNATEFTVFNFAPTRFSLSATTTIYLVADDQFGTSTLSCSGWLRARRVR